MAGTGILFGFVFQSEHKIRLTVNVKIPLLSFAQLCPVHVARFFEQKLRDTGIDFTTGVFQNNYITLAVG